VIARGEKGKMIKKVKRDKRAEKSIASGVSKNVKTWVVSSK
jgi:hypothetical protein